ncbi:hypothetical protein KSP39_PZI016166 [Platanthera zijinensis]|uniref:Uncharacterized protein n=1 Tax=Platanthera zijinensis TaxID=2320716 RepID=A0AAP0G112_9ASPA
MSCGASRTLAKSARLKEEVHTPSRKTLTEFDEILAYTNGTDQQVITLLCTSPNIVPKKLHDQKSPKSFNPAQESQNNIETINAWELLAGLEEDDDNEKREGEIEKGLRRKIMAAELCTHRVATFQMTKTASLSDWLMQGGQGKANGFAVKPGFGGLEKKEAGKLERL